MLHVLGKVAIFLCLALVAVPAFSDEEPLYLVASDFDTALAGYGVAPDAAAAAPRSPQPTPPQAAPQSDQDLQKILSLLRAKRAELERAQSGVGRSGQPVGARL